MMNSPTIDTTEINAFCLNLFPFIFPQFTEFILQHLISGTLAQKLYIFVWIFLHDRQKLSPF